MSRPTHQSVPLPREFDRFAVYGFNDLIHPLSGSLTHIAIEEVVLLAEVDQGSQTDDITRFPGCFVLVEV